MAFFTRAELKGVSYILKKSLNKTASQILMNESTQFSLDKSYDIFLSHSYLDADEVLGLKAELEGMNFSVYVDWIEDKQLSREKVTKETAETLKIRMNKCSCLLFVTTVNAIESKWMPWELGYCDGAKKGKVAILPVLGIGDSSFEGREYLAMYPYVDKMADQQTNEMMLWVNESPDIYIDLKAWLNGKSPTRHSS